MSSYRYLAADLVTGVIREEMPFDNLTWGHVLNNAGSLTADIGTRHPKATRLNLDPSKTKLYVERDGVIVWGGILWTAKAQSGSGSLVNVGAEGFWSYFGGPGGQTQRARFLKRDKTYTNVDPLSIAQDLMNYAQSIPGGSINLVIGNETSGKLESQTYYAYERRNIGDTIEQLASEANGFDFAVDSQWVGNAIVDTFRLYWPMRGRRTNLIFDLGANIEDLTWSLDGTKQANSVDFIGSGSGNTMLIGTSSDPNQLSAYPLLELQASDKTETDINALTAKASSILAASLQPLPTLPSMLAHTTVDTQPGSWITGDQVQVRAKDGYIDVNSWFRIMAYTVNVQSNGKEAVSFTFSDAGAFV